MKRGAAIVILILILAAVLAAPDTLRFASWGAGGARVPACGRVSGTGDTSGASKDYSHGNLIRLHIIANSNDPRDQALKYRVRDAIVTALRPELLKLHSRAEAQALLTAEQGRIVGMAEQVVLAGGYSYPAKMEIGDFAFPTRTYGNLVLPAGNYRAVRIVLGRGAGANWWCVLFPPLCFVDAASSGIPTGAANGDMSRAQAGDGGSTPAGCPAGGDSNKMLAGAGGSKPATPRGALVPDPHLLRGYPEQVARHGGDGAEQAPLLAGAQVAEALQEAYQAGPQGGPGPVAAAGVRLRLRLLEWLQSESMQMARLFNS